MNMNALKPQNADEARKIHTRWTMGFLFSPVTWVLPLATGVLMGSPLANEIGEILQSMTEAFGIEALGRSTVSPLYWIYWPLAIAMLPIQLNKLHSIAQELAGREALRVIYNENIQKKRWRHGQSNQFIGGILIGLFSMALIPIVGTRPQNGNMMGALIFLLQAGVLWHLLLAFCYWMYSYFIVSRG